MKFKFIVCIFFLLCITKSFAIEENRIGICSLDRTVESFDPQTWLSAKTRALGDWVPITFNKNFAYLGMGNGRDTYKNINSDNRKRTDENSYTNNLYAHPTNSSAIFLSSSKTKTIIIFSKSDMGPYFLGTCDLK